MKKPGCPPSKPMQPIPLSYAEPEPAAIASPRQPGRRLMGRPLVQPKIAEHPGQVRAHLARTPQHQKYRVTLVWPSGADMAKKDGRYVRRATQGTIFCIILRLGPLKSLSGSSGGGEGVAAAARPAPPSPGFGPLPRGCLDGVTSGPAGESAAGRFVPAGCFAFDAAGAMGRGDSPTATRASGGGCVRCNDGFGKAAACATSRGCPGCGLWSWTCGNAGRQANGPLTNCQATHPGTQPTLTQDGPMWTETRHAEVLSTLGRNLPNNWLHLGSEVPWIRGKPCMPPRWRCERLMDACARPSAAIRVQ